MKNKIKKYVKDWEKMGYGKGIPDECPEELAKLKLAPSYKAIATAILTNDHSLKSLGFVQKKSKYYHLLKKIEIDGREK